MSAAAPISFPIHWTAEDGAVVHHMVGEPLATVIGEQPTDEEISDVFRLVLVIMNRRQRAKRCVAIISAERLLLPRW